MSKSKKILTSFFFGCVFALLIVTPVWADSPGLIWAIVKSKLVGLGVLNAAGAYTPGGGETLAQTLALGNSADRQINWSTGAGAITHLLGPTDQTFLMSAGTARDLRLNVDSARAMNFSVGASTVLSLASTVSKVAISNYTLEITSSNNTGISVVGGAVSGSTKPVLSATQEWNDAAVTQKGILYNLTNTASAAASRLLDLQVASASVFSVNAGGEIFGGGADMRIRPVTASSSVSALLVYSGAGGNTAQSFSVYPAGTPTVALGALTYSSSISLHSSDSGANYTMARLAETNIAHYWNSEANGAGSLLPFTFGQIGSRLDYLSARSTGAYVVSGGLFAWTSSATDATTVAADTGLSRVTSGVAALGNGTALNASGTLRLTTIQAISGARTCSGGAYIFTTSTTDTTASISAQLTRPSAGAISCDGATPGDATSSFYCGYLYPYQMELTAGKITKYLNVATVADGVSPIRGFQNLNNQSSNTTLTSYVAPENGAYEVSASINVTAATAISTTIEVTYTDIGNTARTLVLPVQSAGGTAGTYLANGAIVATGDYSTPRAMIRVKSGATILIRTSVGTFTSVTYSASAQISRIGDAAAGG